MKGLKIFSKYSMDPDSPFNGDYDNETVNERVCDINENYLFTDMIKDCWCQLICTPPGGCFCPPNLTRQTPQLNFIQFLLGQVALEGQAANMSQKVFLFPFIIK